MTELPTGTVTFLFTDIESSTRLWQEHPEAMRPALARHDQILRDSIKTHAGHVVKTTGDGVLAVFATGSDAIDAAVAAQLALGAEAWSLPAPLRVRMGIHSGPAELRDSDYYGTAVNRAARLMNAAHGGQVVVSGVTAGLAEGALPDTVELWSLGQHRLRDLAAPIAVFQVVAPGLPREFPPLVSLDAFPGNLPVQLSSFVGRAREVADVAALLRENRLVTLTGVGGVGKTRLALQVAVEVVPEFTDGAWLVELAKVRDPAAVIEVVAAALGAPSRPEVPLIVALTRFLRDRRLLLVLDNCEHLLDAAAELVRALESACPNLAVLATSREGLGIRGERLVAVPSLRESESELLFLSRAEAAKRDFVLSDANLEAVREVCRRLDGIPLAIELAAARVSVLSPAQIAARLDRRFALLAGGERGAIERHATLRAAIDWSYDLLEPAEQLMLARLSMFAGGCTLEAAEAVCAGDTIEPDEVIDLVSILAARSLVTVDTSDAEESWYGLLDTVRQYAEERLDPGDRLETRDRHAHYYATWLASAADYVRGPDQAIGLARIAREVENVRAAITWAVDHHDAQLALDLCVPVVMPLMAFLPVGRVLTGAADRVVELVHGSSGEHLAARALAFAAWDAATRGEFDRARGLLVEATALNDGTDDLLARVLLSARMILGRTTGDLTEALEACEGLVSITRRQGQPFDLAYILASLAALRVSNGDFDAAHAGATEALELARRSGAPSVITMAQATLVYAKVGSDPEGARTHLRALTSAAAATPWHDETAFGVLMACGARLGEVEATLIAAARIFDATPSTRLLLAAALENTAAVLASQAPEHAATLRGAADTVAPGYSAIASLRGDAEAVAVEAATSAYQTGQAMTEDEAAAFARNAIGDALRALEETR